ncbi:MAG: small-conductance mechanosensitive channel, partial [Kiritimatiellia bacterium]
MACSGLLQCTGEAPLNQTWTYLELALVMLNTPLPSLFGYSPSQVAGGVFWLTMVPMSWWFVGRRTRLVDRQGVPAALRLSVLGLRLLASAICLILALDILEVVTASNARTGWDDLWQFKIAGDHFMVSTIALMGGVILGAYWGSGWLIRLVTRALEDRDINAGGTIGVLLNLGRYVLIVVGVAVALDTAGVNLTALFTASAALFVGLGFALQTIAQNFISGLILLIEGAIQPGDILEVDGRVVKVVKMSIRSTVVRSLDDEDLIVPNTVLAQGTVKNLTMMN